MNSYQQSAANQRDGQALSVEHVIDAPPGVIFDAFIAIYDSQRPEWVTGSELDLRPGGRWSVDFQVPDGPAFREERVITALERPRRLAYDMTAVYEQAPGFSTTVEVTIEAVPDGHRIRLVQRGFPATDTRDELAGAWPDVLAELAGRVSGPLRGLPRGRAHRGPDGVSAPAWALARCGCSPPDPRRPAPRGRHQEREAAGEGSP
jgi:uncharacterized protein YndB with AHSA1/START domain